MTRRRRYGWVLGLAGAAASLGLAARYGPALGLSLGLVFPSTADWPFPFAGSTVREEISVQAPERTLRADLYRPAKPRRALLLVHGLSPAGRRHPELMRLARLLSRQGVLVLVPHFDGLATFRLSGTEVSEIRSALLHLRGLRGPGGTTAGLGVAGFSFGAGPALLAAADDPSVTLAGSFGGYADLRHVIQYIATGVHSFDGRRYLMRQEEYNRWKLLALLGPLVESATDRGLLEAIVTRKLANPGEETSRWETALGEEGRRILALASSRSPEDVAALIADLPRRVQDALDQLSPLAAAGRLRGRLLIAHGTGDDSIPFTESLRLADAAAGRARLFLLKSFHHTGPQPFWPSLRDRAGDGWSLLRLADELVARW